MKKSCREQILNDLRSGGRTELNRFYRKYNRREYVSPDPLQFLYDYSSVKDREIVALLASSLAYGRVSQILKSVESVLVRMNPSPYVFVMDASGKALDKMFKGFRHRFTDHKDLVSLIMGMRGVLERHGSFNRCFVAGLRKDDDTVLPALREFVEKLDCRGKYLIPSPERGGACKRLNLFLRWMVRKDAVDPGGWKGVSTSALIVPLDTHMVKIGRALGFPARKTPGMPMALEITESFRKMVPHDPVKYDFALTRIGIRNDMHEAEKPDCSREHF